MKLQNKRLNKTPVAVNQSVLELYIDHELVRHDCAKGENGDLILACKQILNRNQAKNNGSFERLSEIIKTCGVEVGLTSLRWAAVADPSALCSQVSHAMAVRALNSYSKELDDSTRKTADTILGFIANRACYDLIAVWKSCNSLGQICRNEDETPLVPIKDYIYAILQSCIAPTDYCEIYDLAGCALETPVAVFDQWKDLASNSSLEASAAYRMVKAAANAEKQWRTGTKMHFDFSGEALEKEYWNIVDAGSSCKHFQVELAVREVLSTLMVGGNHA